MGFRIIYAISAKSRKSIDFTQRPLIFFFILQPVYVIWKRGSGKVWVWYFSASQMINFNFRTLLGTPKKNFLTLVAQLFGKKFFLLKSLLSRCLRSAPLLARTCTDRALLQDVKSKKFEEKHISFSLMVSLHVAIFCVTIFANQHDQ